MAQHSRLGSNLHGLAQVNWKGGPVKATILKIITVNNKKKRLLRNRGIYFKRHVLHII